MNFGWHVLPNVELRGLRPQAVLIMQAMFETFANFGYDCWFTSCVRPKDVDSLHCYGLAVDCDASVELDNSTWAKLKTEVARRLGAQFDVIVHQTPGGRMHMHAEFDPDGDGVRPYKEQEAVNA